MKNENFRVPEREEFPQEEKNDEKARGPGLQKMPEEGEENETVRESESEKVAEPLPANKKRIEANKLSPEANTFSRGRVMVNLCAHSKLKRKGHTEEKYVPAAKISRKQIEVSSRKNSIGKNSEALAFNEITRSLLKVDKSQKIGNGTFGNCYIALYRNEYRVVVKEMKIIESPEKTREEVRREASAITGIGDHWGIPLVFGVCTDQAPFYLVLQFHTLRSESVTLFKAASEKFIQDVAMCANILEQTCEILMFIHERGFLHNELKSNKLSLTDRKTSP